MKDSLHSWVQRASACEYSEPAIPSFYHLSEERNIYMLILVIILVLVLGGGGGYYGHSRWGLGGGAGIGLGTVLVILLVFYLLGGLRF
jgi:hypothetical protein